MVSLHSVSLALSISEGKVSSINKLGPNLPGPKLQTLLEANKSQS